MSDRPDIPEEAAKAVYETMHGLYRPWARLERRKKDAWINAVASAAPALRRQGAEGAEARVRKLNGELVDALDGRRDAEQRAEEADAERDQALAKGAEERQQLAEASLDQAADLALALAQKDTSAITQEEWDEFKAALVPALPSGRLVSRAAALLDALDEAEQLAADGKTIQEVNRILTAAARALRVELGIAATSTLHARRQGAEEERERLREWLMGAIAQSEDAAEVARNARAHATAAGHRRDKNTLRRILVALTPVSSEPEEGK